MNSIPRLSTPSDDTRLDAIPGAVPHPLKLPEGLQVRPALQVRHGALPQ